MMKPSFLNYSRPLLPGFKLTLGITITYLSLLVLIPLASIFVKSALLGWNEFFRIILSPRAMASYELTFGASFLAALLNGLFGVPIAWALCRYDFPCKRFIDAMIDLPFALPTAVAGISLSALYSPNGWIGRIIEPLGIQVAYTRWGVLVALMFISLPFIVRTLQPAIEELDPEIEEAAATLGASRLVTFFKVILPTILPPLITGMALAFARAIGEFGSVIFIAGNMPKESEITPLLIYIQLEQFQYSNATAIAVAMLVVSFGMLLAINLLQSWCSRFQRPNE